ncbi:MAG: SoxR reducing system RseC family protein [Rhodocyclales bacterium]|nr:SoxR reducing system RseC family protein [Rhodocyclales bacterium]
MNESEAVVTRLDGEYAWVDLQPESGCSACGESGGCGLSDGKGKRQQRFPNSIGAQVGDRVMLGVPEGAVSRAVLYCYLLPLATVFALAAAGLAVAGEAGAMLGSLAGLGLGWLVMRLAGRREPLPSMRLKHAVVHLHRK